MEEQKKEFTYEELLQKVKEQEVIINELNQEKKDFINFEHFVNETPDLICIGDTNKIGYFRVVSNGFANVLGYSKEELLSKPFLEFIHPDDLEKTLEEIKSLVQKGVTLDFENRYIKKNGEIVFLQWKTNLHAVNNMLYTIVRDVTEIKITEEKLLASEKSLNEAQKIAKMGSWDFNLATKEFSSSNELLEMFGIENSSNSTDLYTKFVSSFMPEDVELLFKIVENSISKKKPYDIEHQVVLKNKETKWVLCTGIPVLDKNDNVVALKGVVQDITQKKLIDDAIIAKEKAEAASKAKSDFLANMTHEIRTPLNGIVGFTDLLMKTKFDDDQLEYLKTVNESANTLMEIINNILDFSKIESGKLELHFEEIDLIQLLNQIINLFKYEANHKKIELKLEIDDNVPQHIEADSFRLKQILVNLLSNAMKFTFSGSIRLKVVLVSEENLFSKIKFSVIDTGIGIKAANQKKIFQSFIQADNTTTRKYGGTGLGLAISSQLLALKNSELELISTYGKGSEFFFTTGFNRIPNKTDNQGDKKNLDSAISLGLHNSLSNSKILIVEDNKVNMFLVKTMLRKVIKNCQLIEASNGFDAIALAEEHIPDLIFMDIQMPVKNGYDATLEIRGKEKIKHIPVIALTAGVLSGEKEKCLEYGMSDYLTKPIIQFELENVLLKWLKN